MPRRERNPVEEVVNLWNRPDMLTHRNHVAHVWPDMAVALNALSHMLEHAPLAPGAIPLRVVTPSSPSTARKRGSAARRGVSGTNPSSAVRGATQPTLTGVPWTDADGIVEPPQWTSSTKKDDK